MAALHILILSAIPLCLAQFSIQGPSDGNRAAQGLRYSEEKGIEYSDQSDSSGSGDFSIQGATDGNSNFQIQGASDGNADFKIQGASDGNANFQIQGATDGNADFQIQGPTDGNSNFQIQGATNGNANYDVQESTNARYQSDIQAQPYYQTNQGDHRSLQYDDTNGFKLNWKSYAHGQLSPQSQQQQQPHRQPTYAKNQAEVRYAPKPEPVAVAQPAPQPTHQGEERAQVEQPISYRPYDNVPTQIKQLLQFQSQIPYLNAIPEHLRYDAIGHQPQTQAQSQPQEAAPPRQNRPKSRGHQRSKRQTQQHQNQQQYKRIPQPNAETVPRYSTNVPSQIKQLLQFQSQIPYLNAIPEQFRYNLESAPVPVQPHQSQGGAQSASQGNHQRGKRQAHQQQQQQQHQQPQQQYKRISQPPPEPQPNYSTNVPPQIKQLLQFQSQIPYVNAIPEHFRYENLPAQPQHQNSQSNGDHQRGKRQAQNHSQQQQQHPQQQYKRISQPPPEPQPNYSTNVPSQIKQLLQFQSQIPYVNAIPEHFRYENLPAQPQHQNSQSNGDHQRGKRQAQNHSQRQQQHQQQQYKRISQPPPEPQPNYSTNVPPQIKQLLQFQSQIPYVNAIPEHFRYENLPAQPQHQNSQSNGEHQRGKRQAQNHSQQQQQHPQQQYKRISQPPPEPRPNYSTNVPSQIKQLLQFQSQIPYVNAIPEHFRYENLPAQPQHQNSQSNGDHQRGKRQAQNHSQQQQQHPQQQYKRISQPPPEPRPNYSTNVPSQIKQLLQFQSQIPYVNAIPEQFRYNLENAKYPAQDSTHGGHQRGKREAQSSQQGHAGQEQYRRIPQPAPEAQPEYSANLPSSIQQLLNFQAQTPYNIIANQIIYRPDKPYIPQSAPSPVSNYQSDNHRDVRPVTEHK